jgi:RNA-directed DNA polymerase
MLLRIRSHPRVASSAFGALGIKRRVSAGGGFIDRAPQHGKYEGSVDLYTRLRTKPVLHRAWAKVRQSALSSESENTKRAALKFDADWLSNLEKIRDRLKHGSFAFEGEKGVAPPKGKGKTGVRPLVIAPIANRIVRRAILEVLQGYGEITDKSRRRWAGVPAVRDVMSTPTSIGGISKRGVPHGLALIDHAVRSGNHWFVRSDIKNFFTRIPKADIKAFIRGAVNDKYFVNLFEQALATNLENQEELEERRLFKLFPDSEIGVAQGSALSALAGNIALRDFDAKMNGRGILCVRYIDDFILLGSSETKVQAAYQSARKALNDMGMDVYDLSDDGASKDGKVDSGNIHNGTDVLGYTISGTARQPCAAACRKFLEKLDGVVTNAAREMKAAAICKSSSHLSRYHQSMVLLHKIIWGWSQSFRHTTTKHVFERLDKDIDKRIKVLQMEANRLIPNGDNAARRRVMGVHLLADTAVELPPEFNVPI